MTVVHSVDLDIRSYRSIGPAYLSNLLNIVVSATILPFCSTKKISLTSPWKNFPRICLLPTFVVQKMKQPYIFSSKIVTVSLLKTAQVHAIPHPPQKCFARKRQNSARRIAGSSSSDTSSSLVTKRTRLKSAKSRISETLREFLVSFTCPLLQINDFSSTKTLPTIPIGIAIRFAGLPSELVDHIRSWICYPDWCWSIEGRMNCRPNTKLGVHWKEKQFDLWWDASCRWNVASNLIPLHNIRLFVKCGAMRCGGIKLDLKLIQQIGFL